MTAPAPVVVVAVVEIKPGAEDEALAAFEVLVGETHGEEGCVTYALHRDNAEPTRFVFVEHWASQAALDAHMGKPHEKLESLVASTPVLYLTSAVPLGEPGKGAI